MNVTPRETALGLLTLAVALFGGSAVVARARMREWRDLRGQEADIRRQIEVDARLVEQRDKWESRLRELSSELTAYPAGKEMDVHWLSVMDQLARKHGLQIRRLEADKEKQHGGVFELPIDCKDWEGSLDAVVHFLFDLQAQGVMLDVRHLLIKPMKEGVLRGRFWLFCAYTRES